MRENPTAVGIAGSLRDESRTRVAVQAALDSAREAGADTTLVDPRTYDLPVVDAEDRDAGDAPAVKRTVADADAVILGTPVYHGSYAAPLKNVLDYCGRHEFEGTTVGLVAVAGGSFPRTALAHLREVCRALDAWVYPEQVSVPKAGSAVADGELTDEEIRSRLTRFGQGLVRYAGVDEYPDLVQETEYTPPVADD